MSIPNNVGESVKGTQNVTEKTINDCRPLKTNVTIKTTRKRIGIPHLWKRNAKDEKYVNA